MCPSKVCGKCFVKSPKYFVAWFTVSARDTFTFCLMDLVVSEILGFPSKGFSYLVVSVNTYLKKLLLCTSLQKTSIKTLL